MRFFSFVLRFPAAVLASVWLLSLGAMASHWKEVQQRLDGSVPCFSPLS